ncbi:ABC transporter ATP-binding protein [Hyphomicrobium sp. MC8b]|uniref:ABC transporter ATP-binding protein n=1 Tax=Hyphomicrobium sp. MC8b TaxID=300273 RepID=UPI00391A9538
MRAEFAWMASYYRGSWNALLAIVSVAVAGALLAPAQPHIVRLIFDHAIPEGHTALLVGLALLLLAVRFAGGALSLLSRHLTLTVTRGVTMEIRRAIIAGLYDQPSEFHDFSAPGRLQKRIVHDTEQLENHMQAVLSVGLPALLGAMTLTLMMASMSWQVTGILLVLAPPLWFTTRLSNTFLKRNLEAFQAQFELFNKGIYFVLRHMDLTRIRAFEEGELDRQTSILAGLRESGARMSRGFEIHNQIQNVATSVIAIVLLVSGGIAIQHGMLKVGDFVALYIAAAMLSGQSIRLASVIPDVFMIRDVVDRLRELPQRSAPALRAGSALPAFKGCIELEGVSFRRGSRPILRRVDLTIRPGRHVAIRGANGAGKSTLVQLVLGLLKPSEGRLTADGVPYDELDLAALRRKIGFVPQRPDFFGGTLLENIIYGRPEATTEDVDDALRKAGIDDFVRSLPNGLETLVGEGGVTISGGQGQRLAIAAALVARPRLLVFDEPTNHLDPMAVTAIIDTLRRESAGTAVLTISHASALIGSADAVFDLTAGRLTPAEEASA